jgi:hypothetical protein
MDMYVHQKYDGQKNLFSWRLQVDSYVQEKMTKTNLKLIFALVIFLGLFGLAGKSHAITRNVTCSGTITPALQSAIKLIRTR